MNKDHYEYTTNSNLWVFEFDSVGPKGAIRKTIRYSLIANEDYMFVNLGFGDINYQTGEINDLIVSNNNDRDKILATIAATVIEFTDYFPNAFIYAKGSTPARTRLYQMAIAANLAEISAVLDIFGFINDNWYDFKLYVNYEAFSVLRK